MKLREHIITKSSPPYGERYAAERLSFVASVDYEMFGDLSGRKAARECRELHVRDLENHVIRDAIEAVLDRNARKPGDLYATLCGVETVVDAAMPEDKILVHPAVMVCLMAVGEPGHWAKVKK
jgi:hypothetical protein